jgi:hypothetical protein
MIEMVMRISHHGNLEPALAARIAKAYDGHIEIKGLPTQPGLISDLDQRAISKLENYENSTFLY